MIAARHGSVSLLPVTGKSDSPPAPGEADSLASRSGSRAGLIYGLAAYSMWGVFPLYFHALSEVPPWVGLCHRITWSSLFLAVVVSIRGEWKAIRGCPGGGPWFTRSGTCQCGVSVQVRILPFESRFPKTVSLE